MSEWIVYSDNGVDFFNTEDEAVQFARSVIEAMRDEEWPDEVENVLVAKVTHASEKTNVVTRDMLDDEHCYKGRYYPGNFDYYCDYEMRQSNEEQEYRCNICGGIVKFDGTPPVPGNWGR